MAMNEIVIAGCGPGAPACVTAEARDAILRAGVLVGAQRLLDLFPESRALRIAVQGNVEATIRAVAAHRAAGVAVLVTGDPGIASLASGVIAHFGRNACRVVAGISSIQVAFARLGLDWLDARIVSAHGAEPAVGYRELADANKIAVLAGSANASAWIAGLAEYLGDAWRLFLAQDLTLPGESVREIAFAGLRRDPVPARSVLVFVRKELS
jgi:cobalt-precorrin-7 (C5)-methyltransferase